MGYFRGGTYSEPVSVSKPGPFSRLADSVRLADDLDKRTAELEKKANSQDTLNQTTATDIQNLRTSDQSLKQDIDKQYNQLATEIANSESRLEARFDPQANGLEKRMDAIISRLDEHQRRIECLERGHPPGVGTKKP